MNIPAIQFDLQACRSSQNEGDQLCASEMRTAIVALGVIALMIGAFLVNQTPAFNTFGTVFGSSLIVVGGLLSLGGLFVRCTYQQGASPLITETEPFKGFFHEAEILKGKLLLLQENQNKESLIELESSCQRLKKYVLDTKLLDYSLPVAFKPMSEKIFLNYDLIVAPLDDKILPTLTAALSFWDQSTCHDDLIVRLQIFPACNAYKKILDDIQAEALTLSALPENE